MGRDMTISQLTGGERRYSPTGFARWLAIGLGGALLLALLLAQTIRAGNHTATLTDLTLAQTDDPPTSVGLVRSDGETEGFAATETMYTATVYDALDAPVDKVTVAAEAETDATREFDPSTDADTTADGHQVNLVVGDNTIKVVVTSEGEQTTRTYTVKVTRVAASDTSLSALSLGADDADLSPKFDAGTMSYTASVANSVASTTVTAMPTHTGATATVVGGSDADPPAVDLNVGANTIRVVVRAVNGDTQDYTVVVTRAGSAATLTELTLAQTDGTGITLAPVFDPAADPMVYEHTASVANSVARVTVTATKDTTAEDPVISPADADSINAGHQVNLGVGENTITVMVEAEDGSMKTFTIMVTRDPAVSTDAVLTDLTLAQTDDPPTSVGLVRSDGETEGFAATETMYTATVYDALDAPVDKITVTTTSDDDVTTTPGDADTTADGDQVNLGIGTTTITIRVTETGASQTYTVKVTRVAASDTSLSALSLGADDADLSPKFDAGTMSYTASVANSVASTTVTAMPTHTGATATVVGGSDADPPAVDLNVGANTIRVVVRAVNGDTQDYTVVVTRAGSAATLTELTLAQTDGTGITLAPVFDPAADPMVYEHTASVANSVARVTVTATKDTTAEDPVISPADADADTMDAHEVDLMVGENTISVMVEAEDGSMKTYTITVTREGSDDVRLSALTLTDVTLALTDGVTAYTDSVQRHVDSTTVVATAMDTAASVEYMPADADMATKGHQVALGLGQTEITVKVTSSDMTTTSTYTITVNRFHADASLKSLSLGDDVVLVPEFDSAKTDYSASVASTVGTVTVMAAPTDADATVAPEAGSSESLEAGENTITVTVTSSDTTAQTVYTVKVFRIHPDTNLMALSLGEGIELMPEFDPDMTMYTANVDYSTMQVSVTGTPVSDSASMAVQDADGMAIEDADAETDGIQVPLMVGENTIVVNATAGTGDAAVTTPYTVIITRAASSDASLSSLSVSGLDLMPAFASGTYVYSAEAAHDVASTTVMATAMHADATMAGTGVMALSQGANTFEVIVTAADGSTVTYSIVVNRAAPPVEVEVPGPTVTETRTVTRTVTKTVEVPAPAPAQANVIGMTGSATATEVDGRVVIARHDGGASLAIDIGGFIRDADLGQTYQVVRRMDGMIVRQWVSPDSPLVYQIPWAVVNTSYTVPVGVIASIPLDDQSGAPGQAVRRFDGGDDRIFSYAMGQWRHVPDIGTFQSLGLYWCDVTAADATFFDRISMGSPHPSSGMMARDDYPSCSTG